MNQLPMFSRAPSPSLFPGQPINGAGFSTDRRFRYWLSRMLRPGDSAESAIRKAVLWLMLNPSIADETVLDPTLTRCRGFTERLGGEQMLVGNLFALVSTDPAGLAGTTDPVGPENDANLLALAAAADIIVVGWGAHPLAPARARHVRDLLGGRTLHCLGVNQGGSPKHPLYLRNAAELMPWEA